MRLKIAGKCLYDPTCGWDGEAGDLYVEGGRLVAPLPEVDREIEARGQLVTPAAIELRGQVATYGLDFLRLTNGAPSLRELGETYALLGYTHVHEPFLTAWTAGATSSASWRTSRWWIPPPLWSSTCGNSTSGSGPRSILRSWDKPSCIC